MVGLEGFDANNEQPQDFDVIPAGLYEAVIVASQQKPTKAGTGKYMELEFQIINGPQQNRKVWERLNLWNPNDKAVSIAKGRLSALCRAVGVMTPGDSSELHNKPLLIKVVVTKSEQYGEGNEIKSYKPRQSGGQAEGVATEASDTGAPW